MDDLIKNTNILLIAGSITSGKGTLASLLEGHSHCFCLPFLHDKIATGLLDYKDNQSIISWIGRSTSLLPLFKKIYKDTDLSILRVFALQKYITFVASSDKTLRFPTDINYGEFENNLFEDLSNYELITPEIAVKTIFKNLQKCFHQVSHAQTLFVSHSVNGFQDYDKFFEQYKNAKVLFVHRDNLDWFYSFAWRKSQCKHEDMLKNIETLFLKDKRIYQLLELENCLSDIQNKYPANFKIVEFEDLVYHHENLMENICTFLNIPIEESIYYPTIFNNKLPIVKEVQDDVNKLALKEEKELIIKKFNEFYRSKNIKPSSETSNTKNSASNKLKSKLVSLFMKKD